MGFLSRTVFAKRFNTISILALAIFASVFCGFVITNNFAFAAESVDNYGLYTAPDGVRWEWEVVSDSENTNEPQKLNLMFYDKPENLTTVTVPSYNDMTTITGVTPASDTYYVRNADQESQDTRFTNPDPARRTANQTDVTVLDMTNTSKVQIMGVKPIINPETEVELIFGENMVIGDEEVEVIKNATLSICAEFVYNSYYNAYECTGSAGLDFENIQDGISGWDEMTLQEKVEYNNQNLSVWVLPSTGCLWLNWTNRIEADRYDEVINNYSCFIPSSGAVSIRDTEVYGVFSKMHLKLTNLDKVKYLGWYVFGGSTFSEDSRSVTVKANQTAGAGVFAGTNVTDVTFEGDVVYPDMFSGCGDLSSINFGNVETVQYRAFQNTNLGEIDFSQTSIKTILGEAFKNAGLTNVVFDGVEVIDFRAFEGNDLREIYLPKTINQLGIAVFASNTNLKKATVAYDTLTSGTMLQFATVLDGIPYPWGNETGIYDNNPVYVQDILEELVVLAPYEEGEELKPTHLNYYEYRDAPNGPYYSTTMNSPYLVSDVSQASTEAMKELENRYTELSEFRNVIAPLYFAFLNGLKSITISEGFEYIGNAALQSNYSNGTYALGRDNCTWWDGCTKNSPLETVVLPESLKGIGSLALQNIYNEDFTMNLPSGLEFVGIAAFSELFFLKGNVDFPNLRFVGDYAFYSTQVRDIYLHDKIEYIGVGVFNDCPALHDITFDFDVFNPDGHQWWLYGSSGTRNYQLLFGRNIRYESEAMEKYGFTMDETGLGDVKYGTITFTEKAVHPIPSICDIYPSECSYNSFENGSTQSFFDRINVEKIDTSKAPWDNIPEAAFQRVWVGEFLLPESVKEIRASAFLDARIDEELVLPNVLEKIGFKAFSQSCSSYGDQCKDHEFIITSLPETITEIGRLAFYNDKNFAVTDMDLPNLVSLGSMAFMGTTIENVALRDSLQIVENGVFWGVPTIKNIIIDTDLFSGSKYRQEIGNPCNATYRLLFQFGCYFENSGRLKADSTGYDFKYDSITFTDKVQTLPSYANHFMSLINVGTLDMSAAKFTRIPNSAFVYTDIDTLILPTGLEEIGREAFYTTKIRDEVVLPDTLRVIELGAFNNYHWSGTPRSDGVIITKLPDSLEIIGNAAFYYDKNLSIDFDLPNVKRIGMSAFQGTSLRNITLHDSIEEPIFCGAFSNIPTMETLTIDYDFYHYNNNDIDYDYYRNRDNTWFMTNASFFAVFNTTPYDQYAGSGVFYNEEVEIKPYVNVVFTEKAVTNPITIVDSWSNLGFDNAHLSFDKLDLSRTGWTEFDDTYFFQAAKIGELILPESLEYINEGAFFGATIDEPVVLPSALKTIGKSAFQEAKVTFANTFAEGLETIGEGAFYAAQVSGDITIPSSVTSIGWSAFNAGDADTNYGTVTIKPALNYDSTDSQAVFQLFWNAKMDKLVIESPMLPVFGTLQDTPVLPHEIQYQTLVDDSLETVTITPTLRADGEPEFHAMTMKEVEVKNLPVITANAFEECANLESVSFANHDALTTIDRYAFNNDTKLKTFVFGNGLEGKEVVLGTYAFNNTAIETIGETGTDFDLTAANFNAAATHVFANLPALRTVSVPNNFSNKTIPAYTFANDPELTEATIAWELETIDNGAFNNDTKLAKLFVWGNANINEDADLTIPEQTTIFAYSDAPAEAYANAESRNDYDGKFYALDEVLYLTSNKSKVLLEQDEEGNNTGFDKTGLKLYGLRRDGVILESDWQDYNTAFKRTETPEGTNISFEEGRGALGPDDAAIAATVFDVPKPFNAISLTNENFANVDYEFVAIASNNNPLIVVRYPDGYTGNIRNTTLVSTTVQEIIEDITDPEPEEELVVPDTGSFGALIGAATSSVSIATIIVLGGIFIAKRRRN